MAKQTINIGSSANDGTGDPLRTAFDKINDNFTELYNASPATAQITISGNQVSANASNADLVLNGSGTGGVVASGLRFGGTSISADDSSLVNINEGLDVTGNITAEGDITATGNIFANGNINLGNASGDQTKVVGVFEADQVQIDGTTITTNTTNGSLTITGNGTGGVNVDNLTFNDNTISSASNADINLTPGGTGNIVAGALTINGTTLSASDSTQITVAEALDVTGALTGTSASLSTTLGVTGATTLSGGATVVGSTTTGSLITNSIVSNGSNADISIQGSGTGDVVIGSVRVNGTTLDSSDSTLITLAENVNVTGTLTTADVTTTGNTTISGSLTTGTFNVGDLNIDADGKISTDSNGNVDIDPSGTGTVNITADTNITGTASVTGQFNADNLRLDGNVISSTSGAITLSAASGQNVTSTSLFTAGEANFTLMEATTVRADTIQNDTSNGDISISTQGTGAVKVDAKLVLDASQNDGSTVTIDATKPVAILAGNTGADDLEYTLADGTVAGQTIMLVRGNDPDGNDRQSIHVIFSKFNDDGTIATNTNKEIFSQYQSVVTCIWNGSAWCTDKHQN